METQSSQFTYDPDAQPDTDTTVDAHVRAALDADAIRALFVDADADADGADTDTGAAPARRAVLVTGPPRSGKTTFALAAAKEALDVFGAQRAVLAVSNRRLADEYTPELIRHIGVSTQARPATTLNALAFRLVAAQRAHDGRPSPRLLNGAEQDALLRRVLAVHLDHVRSGDTCGTCRLLRDYFQNERWMAFVADGDVDDETSAATTEAILEEGVNAAFVAQLRDMLARMDEVGAGASTEDATLAAVENCGMTGERLRIQWRLAYALRAEYIEAVRDAYPDEYRLDASYLQVAGTVAARGVEEHELPRIVIVDDVQDLTLAGFAFLSALHARGVRLVLVGNPDESVQSFRGSYPEYLFRQIDERLDPAHVTLGYAGGDDYLHVVQARVSLSVATGEEGLPPVAQRLGKMPALPGAYPVAPVEAPSGDTSVTSALYRTPEEEMDDVVWHIKRTYLDAREDSRDMDSSDTSTNTGEGDAVSWNDIAVIMHDNDAIRAYGERLRRDGVPVRFSSVTRPLAEEPFVEGLFSLIELAQLRNDGLAQRALPLTKLAAFVRSRVRAVVASPLLDVAPRARRGEAKVYNATRPVDMHAIDIAMRSLQSIADVQDRADLIRDVRAHEEADEARVVPGDGHTDDIVDVYDRNDVDGADGASSRALGALRAQWAALRDAVAAAHADADHVHVLDDDAGDDIGFGVDAMYLMLAEDGSPDVIGILERISGLDEGDGAHGRAVGRNAPIRRFVRLWRYVATLAERLRTLTKQDAAQPRFALEAAWTVCGVASHWQRLALFNTPTGRAANDRLDVAMRLFDYVNRNGTHMSIPAFIGQVRQLQIEADSLAKTAPLDEAVTLATPAGAVGRHWKHVWLPGVQEGVWPNLAARNTMFGGEDLVDIRLYGTLDALREVRMGQQDPAVLEVLGTEQKGFLVALTRADAHVHVSATLNDDMVPSEFLYNYMPERYDRDRDAKPERRVYTPTGGDGGTVLDADVRGIIALARERLATSGPASKEGEDAIRTLALLATKGYADAGPGNWPFLDMWGAYEAPAKQEDAQDTAALKADAGKEDKDSKDGKDASHALRASIPRISNRPFVPARRADNANGADNAGSADTKPHEHDGTGQPPTVTLSPSTVDALWACPVCARMEREFFGPTVQPFTLDYGSIVHAVLEHATELGWDTPEYQERIAIDDADLAERFRAPSPDYATWDEVAGLRAARIAELMIAYYETLRIDPETLRDDAERYNATLRDEKTKQTLLNVADYFVRSNMPIYEQGPDSTETITVPPTGRQRKPQQQQRPRQYTHASIPTVGTLVDAEPEVSFDACFTLADITAAFNKATRLQVDGEQLAAIMGALIGGWPCAWDHDMRIRLTGRIDRRETRRDEAGALSWRLIDYKTGHVHGRGENFSDLQLVCYQLAMRFPHTEDGGAGERLPVSRAALFDVSHVTYPSSKQSKAEMHYQEPLFAGDGINAGTPSKRADPMSTYTVAQISVLFPDIKTVGDLKTPDVDDQVWETLVAGASSHTLVWSLTMIARVFYAAAASLADTIDAHPTQAHLKHCGDKPICPACAEKLQTIYETKGM